MEDKQSEKPIEDEAHVPFEIDQLEMFHLAIPKEGHIVVDGELQSFWVRLETFSKVKPGQDPAEVAKGMYDFLTLMVNYMINKERELYEDHSTVPEVPEDDIPPDFDEIQ